MLESLGYAEAPARDEADLILFNTCSIRESADSRFIAHLGEAKRLKRERPERVVGVGGCWAQSVKEEVFERFPFVDVAFGPGQVHKLAEFLIERLAHAPRATSSSRGSPAICRRVGRDRSRDGCRSALAATAPAPTASSPPRADARSAGRRASSWPRFRRWPRRRARGDAAGPERQLLRTRSARSRAVRRMHRGRDRRRGERTIVARSPSCSVCSTASRASSASATRAPIRRTCART